MKSKYFFLQPALFFGLPICTGVPKNVKSTIKMVGEYCNVLQGCKAASYSQVPGYIVDYEVSKKHLQLCNWLTEGTVGIIYLIRDGEQI